ncbi:MAG: hypothetical protein ACI86H_001352 [bacterium]|jgi:uncharacterized protein (TIGR00266 family)
MNVEILHGPGNSAARVQLEANETCTAEGGAMISMNSGIRIETTTHKKDSGGFFKAMKRLLSGESFFLNHFTAESGSSELLLAATLPGDMMQYDLDNETMIVQAGSFVACEHDVEMDMGWQGFKSFISGESAFWLKMSGHGKIIINAFGAIYPIEVDGEYIVDTGHIVAFNETLDFSVTKAGNGWISSFLSGEGLVCKFKGKGTVWCQSHNASSFGATIGPMLRPRA